MRHAPVALALLLASGAAFASSGHTHKVADAAAKPASTAAKASEAATGEVRKVDKGAGKLTLKHGPIPSIDMPPMTMVFRVKDPAMLDTVKAGDSVTFKAEKIDGNYTVTEIKPAK